ncbi:class I SAM-dependent methyltransferase [Bizionia gelidisalsuginis]|uniref:Class I SAM-dependent methyltransferase n=2 Tax=Bizionia TaxID=283785 RepID=A0A8H2LEI2_9FLAO|nr:MULTISPECIES: class I SAM-dependent methyltransferase [Bizionia]TYB74528.1 class I SAM-dependent methyltransferase [Bizionia saleffrena]TYC16320.1 class I SAM-dependent methyltransferase [Bizionia gelidisalsuginis]
MKDLFGTALLDYQNNNYTEDIITSTSISEEDTLPIPYLFRSFDAMPFIEQEALSLVKGAILDVGAGAGNHSLYLQNNGFTVKAIDSSKGAIRVCELRGVNHFAHIALLEETETFDTILLLMNGTGIFQTFQNIPKYLKHLKSLLNPGGQILIDSSDITYMFEDEDGGFWQDLHQGYHGEVDYFLSYKDEEEVPMKWLYLDFSSLHIAAASAGLYCEMVHEGEHFDYLARLWG